MLVTEDSAFWTHEGIDFEQLKESMEVNIERMEFARGGSTITQQLAKNLYLSPSKNPIRKVRELLIARRLEAELSKQRILELYLNVIEWGDGIYGAEAAARTYFHKSAADLVSVRIGAARGRDHQPARLRSRRIRRRGCGAGSRWSCAAWALLRRRPSWRSPPDPGAPRRRRHGPVPDCPPAARPAMLPGQPPRCHEARAANRPADRKKPCKCMHLGH